MEKVGKVFEILYLVIAVVFAYEAFNVWQSGAENLYLYIIFIVLAIFMFFFRRKTRIRREEFFNQKK